MNDAQSIVVAEVSMEEWAMLAFRAERAPRRVVVVRPRPEPVTTTGAAPGVGGARTVFWVLLAAAMSTTLFFL